VTFEETISKTWVPLGPIAEKITKITRNIQGKESRGGGPFSKWPELGPLASNQDKKSRQGRTGGRSFCNQIKVKGSPKIVHERKESPGVFMNKYS
jgi:hypothetical protein